MSLGIYEDARLGFRLVAQEALRCRDDRLKELRLNDPANATEDFAPVKMGSRAARRAARLAALAGLVSGAVAGNCAWRGPAAADPRRGAGARGYAGPLNHFVSHAGFNRWSVPSEVVSFFRVLCCSRPRSSPAETGRIRFGACFLRFWSSRPSRLARPLQPPPVNPLPAAARPFLLRRQNRLRQPLRPLCYQCPRRHQQPEWSMLGLPHWKHRSRSHGPTP